MARIPRSALVAARIKLGPKRSRTPRLDPDWHAVLKVHAASHGLPEPEREWHWHPSRQFRFDVAWPAQHVAIEVQGGGWVNGAHHRPAGYRSDCSRLAAAVVLGWRVFYATPEQVEDGEAIGWVAMLLKAESR
jgi:hypothetical protein